MKNGHGAPTEALELTAEQARRFLVRRHFLAPPRALPRAESVLRVVRELGSVQFDPLEVTGARNDDLVLAARIRNYRRGWMERWLYGPPAERQLFEAYNKSLNILPVEELPVHRVDWEHWRLREGVYYRLLKRNRDIAAAILDWLGREGPLPGSAFVERGGARLRWGWEDYRPARRSTGCSGPARLASRGVRATCACTTAWSGCSRRRCSRPGSRTRRCGATSC